LGLGDIGPEASLPVMEGKAALFKRFANVDAYPIALNTQDVDEIVRTVKLISPSFGGINLEDISAPRCFEIEQKLKQELDIPIFHDDQHGTAIVVLAGLINSLKIVDKNKEVKIVINGSGAAGIAITKLLHRYEFNNIIVCDSKGIINKNRINLNQYKQKILEITNKDNPSGSIHDAIKNSDVFIGVSVGNLLTEEDVRNMNNKPIIFAMANPQPEIMPDVAKQAGATIIATGRSDFPNQLNNALVFPGIFKGALQIRKQITTKMMIRAAEALASLIEPTEEKIIPSIFNEKVADTITEAIIKKI